MSEQVDVLKVKETVTIDPVDTHLDHVASVVVRHLSCLCPFPPPLPSLRKPVPLPASSMVF